MNRQMWDNAVTRRNVRLLEDSGWTRLGPAHGEQACGEVGEGRMLEPEELANELATRFSSGALAGLKLVVTAGPTWEAIDPVRGLSNKSSGKMGYAIAAAAQEAGANVVLISGPVTLPAPDRVHVVHIESAEEMLQQARLQCRDAQVFIAAAAVADYRPTKRYSNKPSKKEIGETLTLEPTPDVVATIAAEIPGLFCVGFAAESDELIAKATAKLQRKQLDLVAANRIDLPGQGMNADDNAIVLIDKDGQTVLPLQSKPKLARALISEIAKRYHAKNTTEDSRQANR